MTVPTPIGRRVITAIADVLRLDPGSLRAATDLRQDLALDSVDTIALVLALEDEFGRTIEDDAIAGLHTVADIEAYITSRLPALQG